MKSFTVKTPYEGFRRIFNYIYEYHDVVTTEDGAKTWEQSTIGIQILNPLAEPQKLIEAYCMGPGAVRDYIAQFNDGVNTKGFDYTYYERIKSYGDIRFNQLESIYRRLVVDPETRRAVAVLWDPAIDFNLSHPPCLNWMQALIRNSELNLKVLFRSHDILKAWPANILAIAEMQRRMAEELKVDVGYLEVISSIPHMYLSDIDLIEKTREMLK